MGFGDSVTAKLGCTQSVRSALYTKPTQNRKNRVVYFIFDTCLLIV
jgi:hypothetical protein